MDLREVPNEACKYVVPEEQCKHVPKKNRMAAGRIEVKMKIKTRLNRKYFSGGAASEKLVQE